VPRRLGQHFLSDPAILDRIVDAISPDAGDLVLEIGPGTGTLTRRLAPRVGYVVAIERDARLVVALREGGRGGDAPLPANVTVIEGDALTLDWHRAVLTAPFPHLSTANGGRQMARGQPPTANGERPFKIIGNIPYYVTSPLIERALQPPLPAVVVFLVQREVADRVVAAPGGRTYGALSVGVQAVVTAERPFVVRAGAFRPPPKVDSAVLRLIPRHDPVVTEEERAPFRAFVVGLFGQRRKQLARALRQAAGLTAEAAASACEAIGVAPAARPETLTVADFARLFRHVTR
jgi:16S rRNA (adenine1518-N6/adenine1519-N6)-dimethyltransferase